MRGWRCGWVREWVIEAVVERKNGCLGERVGAWGGVSVGERERKRVGRWIAALE